MDNIVQDAAALVASCEWNEAEAAHDVASILDLQQSSRGVGLSDVRKREVFAIDRFAVEHFRLRLLL